MNNKMLSAVLLSLLGMSAFSFGRDITGTENITGTKNETDVVTVNAGGNVTVDGASAFWDFAPSTEQYSLTIQGKGIVSLTNGGTLDLNSPNSGNSGLKINQWRTASEFANGDADLRITSGTLITDKIANFNGILEISQANAIKSASSTNAPVLTVVYTGAYLRLNASQNFNLDMRANSKMVTSFANNARLSIDALTSHSGGMTLVLQDFENGEIYVDDSTNLVLEGSVLVRKNSHGDIEQAITLLDAATGAEFSKLYWNQVGSGHILSLTAIPEPAEWAAIFGAIALGLAIYRRRK